MKKTKLLVLITLGMLLFLPFVRISTAQGPYVGIEDNDVYVWELSVYRNNWATYFSDNLEETLGNLFPLGSLYNLTVIYIQWSDPILGGPPQSYWPLTITDIGSELTGPALSIYGDNTTITYSPLNATYGYEVIAFPVSDSWPMSYIIVNDTSSFVRQTLNLTLAFSSYGIMGAPFVPTTINWASFATESLSVMSSKGGLYNNVSVTPQSNGYSINIPALGLENNSVAIDIDVTYDSNGVLTYYQFSYGGQMLVSHSLVEPFDPVITNTPSDFSVEVGYTGESISWTATDLNPHTYMIDLQGVGTVAGPTAWSSGVAITYNVPDGLAAGNYTYTITITDDYGNSVSDSVLMTVEEPEPTVPPPIPGYELSIVISVSAIVSIGLIVLMKKKK
ncbi:MAG: hypothetical protein ACFFDN_27345 [Candidatus Hodarchaeota archaeon]